MMIVVGPTQAELILAGFLDLGRVVARLPIGPFPGEYHVADEVATNQLEEPIQ